jgi:hypothetical protein
MFKQSQLSGRTIHIYITRGTHTHTRGFDRELYCGVVVCMYVWELESGRESWSQLRKGYLCPLYFCNVRVFRYLTANVLYSFSVWLYALKDSQSGFSETQPPHNIFYQLLYSRTQSINTPDKNGPKPSKAPPLSPLRPPSPFPTLTTNIYTCLWLWLILRVSLPRVHRLAGRPFINPLGATWAVFPAARSRQPHQANRSFSSWFLQYSETYCEVHHWQRLRNISIHY